LREEEEEGGESELESYQTRRIRTVSRYFGTKIKGTETKSKLKGRREVVFSSFVFFRTCNLDLELVRFFLFF